MRYLLIKYLRKPNGQIDEQVELSKNVKPKDIQTCSVIMDFKEKKVDKCFIEGTVITTDWDKLVEYYKQVYPEVIEDLQKLNP
jgi:coenzyme F420-reducing hydrogenase gamma subunit